LLTWKSEANQKAIKRLAAAIEDVNRMIPPEFFDAERIRHLVLSVFEDARLTHEPFQRGYIARRGFECRHESCRSASVSSARDNALSRTNSLTERPAADAALLRVRFASGVSRRSSFSLRVVCMFLS
jgi:hypothetical protein